MKAKNQTKNYLLRFQGWAQGRIPTDPDPSNEPRGVSGYTFALPGEPDMDRVIYFQKKPGVVHRSHCPEVGVAVVGGTEFVTAGAGGEVTFVSKRPIVTGHPLFGAKVDLLDQCIFASENSTIIYNGFGVMNPFILAVDGRGQSFRRRFYADPAKPQDNIENYDINTLNQFMLNTVFMDSVEMIAQAHILDRTAFRNERKALLEADLVKLQAKSKAKPRDKALLIQIAALQKRLAELNINNPADRRTRQAGTQTLINYPLNAATATVNRRTIKPAAPWPVTMWFGGWDADSLGFFVNGFVQIIVDA